MIHQHNNRNQRAEGSVIKQTLRYAFFLVIGLWLLYQIQHSLNTVRVSHCGMESRLREEHLARVLGRKGDATSSLYTEELVVYEVDPVKDAERLGVIGGGHHQSDKSDHDEQESSGNGAESSDSGAVSMGWQSIAKLSASEGGDVVKVVSADHRLNDQRNQSDQVGRTEPVDLASNKTAVNKANKLNDHRNQSDQIDQGEVVDLASNMTSVDKNVTSTRHFTLVSRVDTTPVQIRHLTRVRRARFRHDSDTCIEF